MGHDRRSDELPHNFMQVLTMSSSPPAAGHCCGSSSDNADDPCQRWRLIEAPEPLYALLAVNGVYYWPDQSHHGVDYITSFDVASERFHTTPHQLYCIEENRDYRGFMDLGGYLAFWSFRLADGGAGEEAERRTFNVHVIEDLHKRGGEWKELFSGVSMDLDFIKARRVRPLLSLGRHGEVMIFINSEGATLWAYHFKSQRWLKVGNNLKELDYLNFCGYHVKGSIPPVPFDSLFSLKQTTNP